MLVKMIVELNSLRELKLFRGISNQRSPQPLQQVKIPISQNPFKDFGIIIPTAGHKIMKKPKHNLNLISAGLCFMHSLSC